MTKRILVIEDQADTAIPPVLSHKHRRICVCVNRSLPSALVRALRLLLVAALGFAWPPPDIIRRSVSYFTLRQVGREYDTA